MLVAGIVVDNCIVVIPMLVKVKDKKFATSVIENRKRMYKQSHKRKPHNVRL